MNGGMGQWLKAPSEDEVGGSCDVSELVTVFALLGLYLSCMSCLRTRLVNRFYMLTFFSLPVSSPNSYHILFTLFLSSLCAIPSPSPCYGILTRYQPSLCQSSHCCLATTALRVSVSAMGRTNRTSQSSVPAQTCLHRLKSSWGTTMSPAVTSPRPYLGCQVM